MIIKGKTRYFFDTDTNTDKMPEDYVGVSFSCIERARIKLTEINVCDVQDEYMFFKDNYLFTPYISSRNSLIKMRSYFSIGRYLMAAFDRKETHLGIWDFLKLDKQPTNLDDYFIGKNKKITSSEPYWIISKSTFEIGDDIIAEEMAVSKNEILVKGIIKGPGLITLNEWHLVKQSDNMVSYWSNGK